MGVMQVTHSVLVVMLFTALNPVLFSDSVAESLDNTPDTITACDGDTVSFSWPCDLPYDLADTMTLTFRGLTEHDREVAAITSTGSVTVSRQYSYRVKTRGTTGIYLEDVKILDSGVYLSSAEFSNGTILERHFTLQVMLPPLLKGDSVKLAERNTSQRCQSITCGQVLFRGFPAVSFFWTTPRGSPAASDSSQDGTSTIQGCPLLPGNYSCRVNGPAMSCGTLSSSSVDSLVVSPRTGVRRQSSEEETKELVLMIIVPIIAVMTPLVILGLWLLRHLLSDCWRAHNKGPSDKRLSTTVLPTSMERNESTAVTPSPSRPDHGPPSPKSDKEEEGQKDGPEQADDGDEGVTDEEGSDPSTPLVTPDTLIVTVFEDVDENDDTRL